MITRLLPLACYQPLYAQQESNIGGQIVVREVAISYLNVDQRLPFDGAGISKVSGKLLANEVRPVRIGKGRRFQHIAFQLPIFISHYNTVASKCEATVTKAVRMQGAGARP